jgi:hypothetical protein
MTSNNHPNRLIVAARVAAGLVVASSLLSTGAGSAQAQSTPAPTLGGFTGSAAASALHVEYNPEGLLPTGSPVDLNSPDALVTISSGPATFARAGIADPGDLLANPDALLSAASSDYPQGAIPPWPFRITAGSGVGQPSAESNPGPGLRARVTAEGGTATAEATGPGTTVPAVVSIGSLSSFADTTTDGTTVTVHSRSEISGLSILGVVEIDSIVTDLTATSTGSATTVDGGTVVTGMSVAGQPAEIDDDGIRAAGIDLSTLLDPLGISITLPGPFEAEGPTAGRLASNGLRIGIRQNVSTAIPGLGDLLDALPPIDPIVPGLPSPEDVIAAARANNVLTIELGRGVVSLTARTPAPRPTPPAASSAPSSSGGAATTPAAPVARPSAAPAARPAATPAAATPVAAAPVATTSVPALSVGAGVGALAVLLLLAQPFLGDRLSRLAAAQLATDQESCPWERR